MRRLVVVMAAVSWVLATPILASGYDKAGHYYSAAVMVRKLMPGIDDGPARLIAFCSQLPDEATELDAVQVYKDAFAWHPIDWVWWGYSTTAESDSVRRMVTVQQLLHALTGGGAAEVEKIAERVVKLLVNDVEVTHASDVDTLCALGLSLHFYGDAYAHQSLREHPWWCTNPGGRCMYPTGRGHADDMHLPDYPLYEGRGWGGSVDDLIVGWLPTWMSERLVPEDKSTVRRNRWIDYVVRGHKNFRDKTWPPELEAKIRARIGGIAGNARWWNRYEEVAIRIFLWEEILEEKRVAESPHALEVLDRHEHEPCQAVLKKFGPELQLGERVPNCRRVWDIYVKNARAAFCDDGGCDEEDARTLRQGRDDYGGALKYPQVYADLDFPITMADVEAAVGRQIAMAKRESPRNDGAAGVNGVSGDHDGDSESPPKGPPSQGNGDGAKLADDGSRPAVVVGVDDKGGLKCPCGERRCDIAGSTLLPVSFDTGLAALEPAEVARLGSSVSLIEAMLTEHRDWWLHIRGHADERGSDDYNRQLSQLRAIVVANWLVGEGGLDSFEGRIIVSGFGKAAPFCRTEAHPSAKRDSCLKANRTVRLTVGPLEGSAATMASVIEDGKEAVPRDAVSLPPGV